MKFFEFMLISFIFLIILLLISIPFYKLGYEQGEEDSFNLVYSELISNLFYDFCGFEYEAVYNRSLSEDEINCYFEFNKIFER